MTRPWLAVVLALTALSARAQPVDAILTGGVIHTGDGPVEALAWRDGLIVYVGPEAGLDTVETGPDTQRINLNGAVAFPGFVDAHVHLSGIGERELTLNLEGTASLADLLDRLAAHADGAPGDGAIVGRGWIETHWPDARFPTAADLDAAVPDRPVILVRADGHAAVVNSATLEAAAIDAGTPSPSGGEILRDADGPATGMLIDKAMDLVAEVAATAEQIAPERALEEGGRVMVRQGWTGVHNMSVPFAQVPVMERLAEAGRLPIRVYNAIDRGDADVLFAGPVPRVGGSGRIVTRAVKVYADGALGSRGAALLAPYADRPDSRGLMLTDQASVQPLYERALRQGVQIATHAIGDRANRAVLTWYAAAFDAVPPDQRAVAQPRWRIEHAQILTEVDIARLARMGVIASMQPSHAIGDLHFAPARLGPERLAGAYAWADVIAAGGVIAGGSDAPVERGSPLIEFYASVARKDLDGYQGAGWHPDQALTRETALKLFTQWPAYAAFAETERGTLTPGTQADISIFDRDLMTVPEPDILNARTVMTVVGGAVVFSAD
ncbi:MAG: amidohydrolase [Rhodothalassiaceae bacterium]